MYIALIIVGLILVGVPIAAILIKVNGEGAQATYDEILTKINPYLELNDAEQLTAILTAINTAESGKKEVKTSTNTATLAKYQRKAATLESNIAQLVTDISDLDDFNNEAQIKKYVSGNVKKLLTKSGINEWGPKAGDTYNSATMLRVGSSGDKVSKVIETGYSSGDEVIIKAKVECNG